MRAGRVRAADITAARNVPPKIHPERRVQILMNWDGMEEITKGTGIQTGPRTKWGLRNRMHGGFTTCTAMSLRCVLIGILKATTIRTPLPQVGKVEPPPSLQKALCRACTGLPVGAAISMDLSMRDPAIAEVLILLRRRSIMVFAWHV